MSIRVFDKDYLGRKSLRYSVVGTLAVVLIVLISSQWSSVVAQMNDWKLLPQPERLTELYINDHRTLPSTYTPDTPQTFSFTIHNLEYKPVTYHYIVQAVGDNQNATLDEGDINLNHDQLSKLSPEFTVPDLGPRIQINITVTNSNESIHYWMERV